MGKQMLETAEDLIRIGLLSQTKLVDSISKGFPNKELLPKI